jgi:GNAT superfamily N-acetyltransferase
VPAPPAVRRARPDEFDALRRIEFEADALFETVGIGPFSNREEDNHLPTAAAVFVTGDPPVGFAAVGEVGGLAHLWQIAVLPPAGRQGHGTALMEAVFEWARSFGYPALTLTTFADVPWNAPYYARFEFRIVDESSADFSNELAAIRAHEREIGDDDFGPRVAMIKVL